MPTYENNTELPVGIRISYGVLTITPEVTSKEAYKLHLIQWKDKENRPINVENIVIKQYDTEWQNQFPENVLEFIPRIQSDKSDGLLKLREGNIGFSIQYQPYTTTEEYSIYFIVTIKIEGENSFDIAFNSSIKGGNQSGGVGDVNILPGFSDK